MKYLTAVLLILTAVVFPFICRAEELEFSALSGAEIETLGNGLTLVTKNAGLPGAFTAQIWVRAGSFHEVKELGGVSSLLSMLLWEDRNNTGILEFREAVSGSRGRAEANLSKEFMYFSLTAPKDSFSSLFPRMMRLIFKPEIEDTNLQVMKRLSAEKTGVMEKFQRYLLNKKLYGLAYGDYGLSNGIYGDSASISAVPVESVTGFHEKYFTAGNSAVIITGDFDRDAVRDSVRASESALRIGGEDFPPVSGYLKAGYPVSMLSKENFQRSVIASAYYAPDIGNPRDVMICDLFLYLLGIEGAPFRKLVLEEKKLADEMLAEYQTRRRGDIFRFEFVTSKKNIKTLQAELASAFASIKAEGFTDTEIAAAKKRLYDAYIFDNINPEKLAYTAGYYWALGVPDFERNYIRGIRALEKNDIDDAFRRYFDMSNNVTLILVGDNEK